MPAYPESLLQVIDGRVADGQLRVAKMGTVVDRSPGSTSDPDHGQYWAMVAMDGSSGTPQPVKCFESTVVDVGDRVGIVKYESEWIITGNYTLRGLGEIGAEIGYASQATTTSGTFVDMPTAPSAIVMKYRDATLLRIDMFLSMRVSVAPTVVDIGAAVLSFDGVTNYDETLARRAFNAASDHRDVAGGATTGALAGGQTYAVTARWRRISGTGTLTVDDNDTITIRVREVIS